MSKLATSIVTRVLTDLKGRSGIGNSFDDIDKEIMQELENTLSLIVDDEIRKSYKIQHTGDGRDETHYLYLNGVQLSYVNYYEHGSAGMEVLEGVLNALPKALGYSIDFDYIDEPLEG